MILFSDPGQLSRKIDVRESFSCALALAPSPDASHPRLPTPSACHPVVVDDATHLVAPRRRRRTVIFARDHHSRVEFSRRRRYKRIVTNLLFPFSLCAACQNGLDHRRRSGIPSRRSRLISLLKSVICNDSLN